MSEMIRKITGIGDNLTHYIPVVYYCVCSDAANEIIKNANWIGNSDGTEVSPNEFELYEGMTFAVLFENGFGIEENPPTEGFKFKVYNNEAKRLIREGDALLKKVNPNSVVMLSYDGENFRLVGGVSGAQLDELREEILGSYSDYQGMIVLKGGEFNDETATGDVDQPIYVNNSQVVPINSTYGSSTNPIWMNSGHFTPSDATVGSVSTPIYLHDGDITASTITIGSNIIPLKMVNGALTPVAAALATEANLNALSGALQDEVERAQQAESDLAGDISSLSGVLNDEIDRAQQAEGVLSNSISDLSDFVDQQIQDVNNLIFAESDRAQGAELDLSGDIADLNDRLDNFSSGGHQPGSYNFGAVNSSSGLTTEIPGIDDIQPITLTIPIYWGTTDPALSNVPIGSLYFKIEQPIQ